MFPHCSYLSPPQEVHFFLKLGVLVSFPRNHTSTVHLLQVRNNPSSLSFTSQISTHLQGYLSLFVSKSSIVKQTKKKRKDLFCNLHFTGPPLPALLYLAHSTCECASSSAIYSSPGAHVTLLKLTLLGTLLVKIEHILVQILEDYSHALKCHFLPCHLCWSHLLECCDMISTSHLCRLFSHLEFCRDTNIGIRAKTECACCLYFPGQLPGNAILVPNSPCWKKFHSCSINLSLLASALQTCITVRIPNTCAEWLKSGFKPETIALNVWLFFPFNLSVIVAVDRVGFQQCTLEFMCSQHCAGVRLWVSLRARTTSHSHSLSESFGNVWYRASTWNNPAEGGVRRARRSTHPWSTHFDMEKCPYMEERPPGMGNSNWPGSGFFKLGVQSLVLPQVSCATLCKSLNLSRPQSLLWMWWGPQACHL